MIQTKTSVASVASVERTSSNGRTSPSDRPSVGRGGYKGGTDDPPWIGMRCAPTRILAVSRKPARVSGRPFLGRNQSSFAHGDRLLEGRIRGLRRGCFPCCSAPRRPASSSSSRPPVRRTRSLASATSWLVSCHSWLKGYVVRFPSVRSPYSRASRPSAFQAVVWRVDKAASVPFSPRAPIGLGTRVLAATRKCAKSHDRVSDNRAAHQREVR